MSRRQTCFEVTVTPPYKKKKILETSPILILEKFKGSPSLIFKDVKVGSSACKGFWVENPNDCTTTVILSKLPPAERGLSFSSSEFVLESGGSHRIEVTWSPTSEGSWRDVVHVQVWGLPPPHLSFRVIMHLTSVLPKIKRKCCQMERLNPRNVPFREKAGSSKLNIRCGSCHFQSAPKAANGKGKENLATKEAKLTIEKRTPKRSSINIKENWTKEEPKLIPEKRVLKRSNVIDRDSLENNSPEHTNLHFVSIVDGSLPPCDVPSTPIRRSTYSITNYQECDIATNPIHTATFTIEENAEYPPEGVVKTSNRFLKALEEVWSPVNFQKDINNENGNDAHWTPTRLKSMQSNHGPEQCSTEIKTKNYVSPSETVSAKSLFSSLEVREGDNRPIESSPMQHFSVNHLLTPSCSPISSACQDDRTDVSINKIAGYCVNESRPADISEFVNINHTFIKYSRSENEMEEIIQNACVTIQRNWRRMRKERVRKMEEANRLKVLEKACITIQRNWRLTLLKRESKRNREVMWMLMNNACCLIQKNWRLYLAKKQAKKQRKEIQILMQNASYIIQRSWRYYLARRQARIGRTKMLQDMNDASSIIQRSWRYYLARRQARIGRTKMLQDMNDASSIIQRSWRYYLARRQARIGRTKMLQDMNDASSIIQRSWRYYLARRQARIGRTKMLQDMNDASSIIQRSWRYYLARRQARIGRTKMLQDMNDASSIIQRSWRYYLARRQARIGRTKMLQDMNDASSIIQRSWRYYLARRQARIGRTKMLQDMNDASSIIQRSWRYYLARRQARIGRTKMLQDMNDASSIIQRSWRFYLARRQARIGRTKMLQDMNDASSIIQRSWRYYLARRQARIGRTKMLQDMNDASSIIQRSWKNYLVRKAAARERVEKWVRMHNACCVIQRSWREYIERKLIAKERAEILTSLARKYAFSDEKSLIFDSVNPDKCFIEMVEKFHLKPRAYELLFELAELHTLENLYPAFLFIQRNIGKLASKKSPLPRDVSTQTDLHLRNQVFSKPRSVTKTFYSKLNSSSKVPACRSLMDGKKGLSTPMVGYLSPNKVKYKQREVPEQERWSCVAEAVGRQNFTPQK